MGHVLTMWWHSPRCVPSTLFPSPGLAWRAPCAGQLPGMWRGMLPVCGVVLVLAPGAAGELRFTLTLPSATATTSDSASSQPTDGARRASAGQIWWHTSSGSCEDDHGDSCSVMSCCPNLYCDTDYWPDEWCAATNFFCQRFDLTSSDLSRQTALDPLSAADPADGGS